MTINLAELAFLSWKKEEEVARQKAVVLCRQFFDGEQATKLTARMKEFLNTDDDREFNLNVCETVVSAMTDRLLIQGINSNEGSTSSPAGAKPLATWADRLFEESGLNILQHAIHENALVDGEHFVIVDWDEENQRPQFIAHDRYTDPTVDGDGFGCKAHYPDEDTNQPLQSVSKRWIEQIDTKGKTRSRLNLYFPDRVEKYQWAGSDWVKFGDPGDKAWPIPRLDRAGKPLGIQAIHFPATPKLRSEVWSAIPSQRAINKALIDLLAAADSTGFRILATYGWIPTTDGGPLKADGSNRARIQPGTILGTTKSKSEAGLDMVEGADLASLIETISSLIGWMAAITNTPSSRFSLTKMVAAEGTLKQQNEGLFAKTRKRQMLFDRAWIRCFDMARKLANTFGNANLPEEPSFVPQWEPIQARDTAEEQNEWKVKRELGVPLEWILAEMGYSQEEIDAMKQTEEWQARMSMMQMGLNNGDGARESSTASPTDG
jgi:hypothetical protein